jgi:hypothetical protein
MTVSFPHLIREVQIPLVAVMLLVACLTKARVVRRSGPIVSRFGPTALFPVNMRKPVAIVVCAAEAVLGLSLIVTACGAAATGGFATATAARLGAGLLFLVATSTLIELRTVRPDVGCGCFGDYSTSPVSGRTITRSAFFAAAILSTVGLHTSSGRITGQAGLEILAVVCAELAVIAALSPEIGTGLIRLGYSEPCELKHIPSARTLTALRRSKEWRQHAGMITSDVPGDVWRELCWRYVVYPSSYDGRSADLVFAVFLQYRRPVVHTALVDSVTGLALPLPAMRGRRRPRLSAPVVPADAQGPVGGAGRGVVGAGGGAGGGASAGAAAGGAAEAAGAAAAAAVAARLARTVTATESVATTAVDLLPRQRNATSDRPDQP